MLSFKVVNRFRMCGITQNRIISISVRRFMETYIVSFSGLNDIFFSTLWSRMEIEHCISKLSDKFCHLWFIPSHLQHQKKCGMKSSDLKILSNGNYHSSCFMSRCSAFSESRKYRRIPIHIHRLRTKWRCLKKKSKQKKNYADTFTAISNEFLYLCRNAMDKPI